MTTQTTSAPNFVQTNVAIPVVLNVLGACYPCTITARKYTSEQNGSFLKFSTQVDSGKGWVQLLVFADKIGTEIIKPANAENLAELTAEIVNNFQDALVDNLSFNPEVKYSNNIHAPYLLRTHGQIQGHRVYSHQFSVNTVFFYTTLSVTSKFAISPTEGKPVMFLKTTTKSYLSNKTGTLRTAEAALKTILG